MSTSTTPRAIASTLARETGPGTSPGNPPKLKECHSTAPSDLEKLLLVFVLFVTLHVFVDIKLHESFMTDMNMRWVMGCINACLDPIVVAMLILQF